MSDPRRRILIAGANIAGLGAAIALRDAGLEPVVFERMTSQPPVRGGLHIWTNGSKALNVLGVGAAVRSAGDPVERALFRRHDGAQLIETPIGEYGRKHGNGAFFVPRAELPRALLEGASGIDIRFDSEVVGFEQDVGGVTVRLASGDEERGQVLVGADGINSRLRTLLFGAAELRYSGYQDWGAVVEFSSPKFPAGEFWTLFGPGTRAGLAHVGAGHVYWAASIQRREDDRTPVTLDEMRRIVSGWVAPVEELVAATPPKAMTGTPIREVRALRRWSRGRVTLIGDAAHAMEPAVGRGASEALEDGVTLARTLAALRNLDDGDVVAATLRGWSEHRRRGTQVIAFRSRQIGMLGKLSSPASLLIRDTMLRALAPVFRASMKTDFQAQL